MNSLLPLDTETSVMKIVAAAILAFTLAGTTLPALAHTSVAAWYGGQIQETPDGIRVEFAVRDGAVRAWVRDHDDRPIGAGGKAVLLVGGKKIDAAFTPDGDSLQAAAAVTPADKLAAILSLTVNGKPVAARFSQEALIVPTQVAPAGKQVFEQNCAVCHGTALRGSDHAPPLLHPSYAPGSGHGDEVILAAARTGAKSHMWKFGDMPKPEGLKPGQEKDVLAYIRAMQAANGLGTDVAMPMDHSNHMSH